MAALEFDELKRLSLDILCAAAIKDDRTNIADDAIPRG